MINLSFHSALVIFKPFHLNYLSGTLFIHHFDDYQCFIPLNVCPSACAVVVMVPWVALPNEEITMNAGT